MFKLTFTYVLVWRTTIDAFQQLITLICHLNFTLKAVLYIFQTLVYLKNEQLKETVSVQFHYILNTTVWIYISKTHKSCLN